MTNGIPDWYLEKHPNATYEQWEIAKGESIKRILSYREGYTDESALTKMLEAQVDQLTKENKELKQQIRDLEKIID